jgi:putative phosphoesterase
MQIAVISDSHDHVWKLDQAMPHLREADATIHCGDLCSPFVVRRLGEGIGAHPIHIVWGNNDGDKLMITRVAKDFPQIVLHGHTAMLELEGVSVAVNHYPELARPLALSGQYDLVCYGHDHTVHEERLGPCLLLNPGEIMGLYGKSTLALVELPSLSVRMIEL